MQAMQRRCRGFTPPRLCRARVIPLGLSIGGWYCAMARVIEIEPQQVAISAPQSFVFDLVARADYDCLPGSGRSITVMSRDGQHVVVAFSSEDLHAQVNVVKEISARPPDRVVYRHIAGPYIGAVEELSLLARRDGTDLILEARVNLVESSSAELHKYAFEHEAHQHLRDIKAAAEGRSRPLVPAPTADARVVEVPAMTNEQQLLQAVDDQEEAEWGHSGHGRGVARIALSLAESIMLPKRQVDTLMRAALLHDVGKLALSSTLWGTLGLLSDEERDAMRAHARLGADLAARAGVPDSIQTCILHHHERWDGAGYPAHLAGDAIPLRARILAIGESVDTMMRATYRRETLGTDQILAALDRGAGSIWDPMLAREARRIIKGK
jgi:putative nucleotidyltransferase with HDIG domain